jgi:hypothetical protein
VGVIQWPTGEVRWHWHVAATLRDLRITIPKRGHGDKTVRATVVSANTFQLAQQPLVLTVPFGKGGWAITSCIVQERQFRATLGAPIE